MSPEAILSIRWTTTKQAVPSPLHFSARPELGIECPSCPSLLKLLVIHITAVSMWAGSSKGLQVTARSGLVQHDLHAYIMML